MDQEKIAEKLPPKEKAFLKAITIFPRHQRFLEEKSINLSRFVQKKLDEEARKS